MKKTTESKVIVKGPVSQKAIMIWALFFLFAYVCIFVKDPVIVGTVGGVFTITINWLFRLRSKENVAKGIIGPGQGGSPA